MHIKNVSQRLSLRWVRHAINKPAYMNATANTLFVLWANTALAMALALRKGANARYATITNF
jgi:ABC-type spermidine/putrescine transport system permease subunit II